MDIKAHREQAGITKFTRVIPKSYLSNPNVRRFMVKFIPAVQKSIRIRNRYKKTGICIPSFITAGIGTQNAGYNVGGDEGGAHHGEMNVQQWRRLFEQSAELGIAMIILMCGESAVRKDVLETAAEFKQIIFPAVIDNTLINQEYTKFFDTNRNLMPVLNVDYGQATADRKNTAAFEGLKTAEKRLKSMKIPFGACITITKKNINEITDPEFVSDLKNYGYTNITFLEQAPEQDNNEDLLLSKSERKYLESRIQILENKFQDLIILYFPRDDNLASNKENIHINANGGVESFYNTSDSDLKNLNIKNCKLFEVFEFISSYYR